MTATTITLIDYGIGNLRSVQKALEHAGATVHLTADADAIASARKLLLPGVGAFGAGIDALQQRGLIDPILKSARAGVPFLGICLGMQLLFEDSDELGSHRGLGLIPGNVRRLDLPDLPVPHMGWNQIEHDGSHPLLQDVPAGAHAYFVHSYYCRPQCDDATIGATTYGLPFASVVAHGNIFGFQFHPEKSQHVGLQMLKNFIRQEFS